MDLENYFELSNNYAIIKSNIINYLDNNDIIDLYDLKNFIKNDIKKTLKIENIRNNKNGLAFPIGLCVDNIVAHYSPSNDGILFNSKKSIIKIDFGLHKNGNIIDLAFNYTKNEDLKILKKYSEEATEIGIKNSGIDVNVYEIGAKIEEYINSLEIEINGKKCDIKSFENLCGHKIGLYKIHDGVPFPNIDFYKKYPSKISYRMKENDVFAIEPYLTTGIGEEQNTNENYEIYSFDYMKIGSYNNIKKFITPKIYKSLPKNILKKIDNIQKKFNFLPFEKEDINIDDLLKYNLFNTYPVISDIDNSYVAQTEKNIYVMENKIHVF